MYGFNSDTRGTPAALRGAVVCVLLCAGMFVSPALAAEKKKKQEYSHDYVGEMRVHRAVYEDTLVHLARDNNLGFVEMRAANPTLDPWIPGAGVKVILPTQHLLPDAQRQGIVINLPEMRLYAFVGNGGEPVTYPIGIGREGLRTPLGKTTVIRKAEGPTWRPTPRMREEDPLLPAVVPPGPENPMGTHAIYLGFPQIAIHGTNRPYSIGRRISSGCIRMYPEGITDIYGRIPVGTPVRVVDQAVKVGWIEDKMYIEVHPTQEQSTEVEDSGELVSYEITPEDMNRILENSGDYAEHIDWERVRKAVKDRRGYPVAVLDAKRKVGSWAKDDLMALIEEAEMDPASVGLPPAALQGEGKDSPAKANRQDPKAEKKKAGKEQAAQAPSDLKGVVQIEDPDAAAPAKARFIQINE